MTKKEFEMVTDLIYEESENSCNDKMFENVMYQWVKKLVVKEKKKKK